MALFGYQSKLMLLAIAIFCCCLSSGVDSNPELANNYNSVISTVRKLVTHPYRSSTTVMTGGRGVVYVSIAPLAGVNTSVELILTYYNLSLIGYRVCKDDNRVVVLFSDANSNALDWDDYDLQERLDYGGNYKELTKYVGKTRQQVLVNAQILRDGIQLLEDKILDEVMEKQRAEFLLALMIIISEGARFTKIHASVQQALSQDTPWHASCLHVGLMKSWIDLSIFIADNSEDVTASSIQYFPILGQEVTLKEALVSTAVILRCFQTPSQSRFKTNTIPDQCKSMAAVDAAFSYGPDTVYLLNGPNFAFVRYTTDDIILGTVKSIFDDCPFLQGTEFVKGIDAAFHVPDSSMVYIFRGNLSALIDVSNKSIISGPKTIYDLWPSVRNTKFVDGFDAALKYPRKNHVYLFRDEKYIKVQYTPGSSNDKLVGNPRSISDGWPTLRGTVYANGFDSAFTRPGLDEAYLFDSDTYLYDDYNNGGGNKHSRNSVKIRDGWTSLQYTAFDV